MQRCPSCNARLKDRIICSRCKADLSALMNSELAAQQWIHKALEFYINEEIEQSIAAITLSVNIHKSHLTFALREFMIDRQCRAILDLLAEKQVLEAKNRLYIARMLLPYSKLLQQLNAFADYLLVKPG